MNDLLLWRRKNLLSQEEMAGILGVTRGSYCAWERGKKTPNLENYLKIEQFLMNLKRKKKEV